jgi:DNA-binding NtrC family response regulator
MIWYVAHWSPDRPAVVSAPAPVLLLAEDDDAMRFLIRSRFTRKGWDVVEARTGDEAVEHLGSSMLPDNEMPVPDVVITDVRMPRFSGLDVLTAVKQLDPTLPVILTTAFPDRKVEEEARWRGARALFAKPFDLDALLQSANDALKG